MQAEELNTILGNAFKMAYAYQQEQHRMQREVQAKTSANTTSPCRIPQNKDIPSHNTRINTSRQSSKQDILTSNRTLQQQSHNGIQSKVQESYHSGSKALAKSMNADDLMYLKESDKYKDKIETKDTKAESLQDPDILKDRLAQISTASVEEKIQERKENKRKQVEERDRQRMQGKERSTWVSDFRMNNCVTFAHTVW